MTTIQMTEYTMMRLGEWVKSVSAVKLAVGLIVTVGVFGYGAGLTTSGLVGKPAEVDANTEWRAIHDTLGMHDDASAEFRALSAAAASFEAEVSQKFDGVERRLIGIENLLSCIHYQIAVCPSSPPPPPTIGRLP